MVKDVVSSKFLVSDASKFLMKIVNLLGMRYPSKFLPQLLIALMIDVYRALFNRLPPRLAEVCRRVLRGTCRNCTCRTRDGFWFISPSFVIIVMGWLYINS